MESPNLFRDDREQIILAQNRVLTSLHITSLSHLLFSHIFLTALSISSSYYLFQSISLLVSFFPHFFFFYPSFCPCHIWVSLSIIFSICLFLPNSFFVLSFFRPPLNSQCFWTHFKYFPFFLLSLSFVSFQVLIASLSLLVSVHSTHQISMVSGLD